MSAKGTLELTPDGTIIVTHSDGTVLLTGKATSTRSWNNITEAILRNVTEATGPMLEHRKKTRTYSPNYSDEDFAYYLEMGMATLKQQQAERKRKRNN